MPKMIWNIPNSLTLSRIAVIPLTMYFYLAGHYRLAFFTLLYSVLTDYFDGVLARKLNQATHIGEILDPIADKFVSLAFYSFLWWSELAPWPFCALVVLRNFAQIMSIPILVIWLKRKFYVKPKKFAKWTTAASDLYIFFPLFINIFIDSFDLVSQALMVLITFMEVRILVTYLPRLIAIARGKHDTFE